MFLILGVYEGWDVCCGCYGCGVVFCEEGGCEVWCRDGIGVGIVLWLIGVFLVWSVMMLLFDSDG